MAKTTTRWAVSVTKQTDEDLRSYLANCNLPKGNMSKFIEDAVNWRLMDLTLDEARTSFSDISHESLETLIDEAVLAARRRP